MSVGLNKLTLILNKSWHPVQIRTARRAFIKVFAGIADIVDISPDGSFGDYMVHDFDSWAKLSIRSCDEVIETTGDQIRVPKVVVLKDYDKVPRRKVRLSRKNLLIRDGHRCAYTGIKLSLRAAQIDHVMPRSRGGLTTWENVVVACEEANRKKADRTPEEANMPLRISPKRPSWHVLFTSFTSFAADWPSEWKHFIHSKIS